MMSYRKQIFYTMLAAASLAVGKRNAAAQQSWKPVEGKIMTQWAADVNPEKPLPEYPRPQLQRSEWQNLNGLWDYKIVFRTEDDQPDQYDGKILVPYAIESALSGVGKTVGADKKLWYHRSFSIPENWKGQRVLLHFGAVDWETTVYVNGKKVGDHQGGYDAFSFDVTDYLIPGKEQQLTVSVWDPTDEGSQPRGKQVNHPNGIWYTSVTGIWQTVWIEPVRASHIRQVKYFPDIDNGACNITVNVSNAAKGMRVKITALDQGKEVSSQTADVGANIYLRFKNAKLWTPDDPFLYDLKIELLDNKKVLDDVKSYVGLRKISVEKDDQGIPRIMLNHKFLFQLGFLDQGWWPDGLYTPPTDEAIQFDLKQTKAFGYNLLRKHTKVEPERWYYYCDKMGILVWQDMPTGDMGPLPRNDDGEVERTAQSSYEFDKELKAMIDQHFNHPSIVQWVPFNESWGQFNTIKICNWVEKYDPTRLVDGPSGWIDFPGAGNVEDMHKYPGPGIPESKGDGRARVLGEYGGLGLPLEGHTWQGKQNWGYVTYKSQEELRQAYMKLIDQLPGLIRQGLCAAVYTQLTDVEIEVNGFMTYDRKVLKLMSPETVAKNKSLFEADNK